METVKSFIKKGAGFTLLEVLFAVVLVGMVIAALAASSGAFTLYNAAGLDLSTAEFLVEEVREMTAPLPVADPVSGTASFGIEAGEVTLALYDDVDDFNNRTINPPVDADRNPMPEFSSYTQRIDVDNVNPADLTQTASPHTTDFYRITVTITKNGQLVTSSSWIRARY